MDGASASSCAALDAGRGKWSSRTDLGRWSHGILSGHRLGSSCIHLGSGLVALGLNAGRPRGLELDT